jgi:mRNA interferase RelE/StbE
LSDKFIIAETDTFQKTIQKLVYKSVYNKIKNFVYPQLRINPFFGPNIKKLKGKLSGIFRYRIGNNRLFYTISTKKIIVFIVDLSQRKESYRK